MKKLNCILLIDDNLASNAFHLITIKKTNACDHVKTATTGRKALDFLLRSSEETESSFKPDLIYLDINLPGMNGFEFMDEYKKLKNRLDINPVIIILSSSSNPDDYKKAMSYEEISGYQNKPLTIETINSTLEKYFA